jgi:adenylylsulfate kinase
MKRSGQKSSWALWFVGLPGCGKTTYARSVHEGLLSAGEDAVYLSMDERRKKYFPKPEYSAEERAEAYRLFAEEAARVVDGGTNVIMDGTAPKLEMRQHARRLITRFAEIYIKCSLEVAMSREAGREGGRVISGLYRKAIERKTSGTQFEGLGEVVGVDTPFEEDPAAECFIDSERMTVEEGRNVVLDFISRWDCR